MGKQLNILFILMLFGCSTFENMHIAQEQDVFQDGFFGESEVNTVPQEPEETNTEMNIDKNISMESLVNVSPNQIGVIETIAQTELHDSTYDYLYIRSNQSLKSRLQEFLTKHDYKLIWRTENDIVYGNESQYQGEDAIAILRSIAGDLSEMGVDIHMNVYLKNKVVLVYSVRN